VYNEAGTCELPRGSGEVIGKMRRFFFLLLMVWAALWTPPLPTSSGPRLVAWDNFNWDDGFEWGDPNMAGTYDDAKWNEFWWS